MRTCVWFYGDSKVFCRGLSGDGPKSVVTDFHKARLNSTITQDTCYHKYAGTNKLIGPLLLFSGGEADRLFSQIMSSARCAGISTCDLFSARESLEMIRPFVDFPVF